MVKNCISETKNSREKVTQKFAYFCDHRHSPGEGITRDLDAATEKLKAIPVVRKVQEDWTATDGELLQEGSSKASLSSRRDQSRSTTTVTSSADKRTREPSASGSKGAKKTKGARKLD